jgi:hypothetical protein
MRGVWRWPMFEIEISTTGILSREGLILGQITWAFPYAEIDVAGVWFHEDFGGVRDLKDEVGDLEDEVADLAGEVDDLEYKLDNCSGLLKKALAEIATLKGGAPCVTP